MSQRFEIPCPQCGTLVAVSTDHVGKKGRCPECKTVFPITAPGSASPPADLQPLPVLRSTSVLEPMPPVVMPPVLVPLEKGGAERWRTPSARPLPPGLEPLLPELQVLPLAQAAAPVTPSVFDDLNKPAPPFARDELPLADNPYPAAGDQARSHAQGVFKRLDEDEKWKQEIVRQDLNGIMWMGVGMMAFAVVWFVAGLFFGILFFRDPPILFVVGVGAFIKGLLRYRG